MKKKTAKSTSARAKSGATRAKRPGSAGKTMKERRVAVKPRPEQIPGEGERIRVGDPDDSAIDNEYVGDETPGGSSSTPDQNSVDDIGSAYGLQEEDTGGPLHSAAEILERRDRHRATMDEPPRGGKAYKR